MNDLICFLSLFHERKLRHFFSTLIKKYQTTCGIFYQLYPSAFMEGPEVKRNLGTKWVDPFNATELFLYPLEKSFPMFSGGTERDQQHEKN